MNSDPLLSKSEEQSRLEIASSCVYPGYPFVKTGKEEFIEKQVVSFMICSQIIEEDILKRCIHPGIHVLNPFTGLGKSHGVHHASVFGLLDNFERVVYVVPQLKLRDEGVEGIMRNVKIKEGITEDDILILRSRIGNFTEVDNIAEKLNDFVKQYQRLLSSLPGDKLKEEESSDRDFCSNNIAEQKKALMENVWKYQDFMAEKERMSKDVYECVEKSLARQIKFSEEIFRGNICKALKILKGLVLRDKDHFEYAYDKLRNIIENIYPEVKLESKRIIILSSAKLVNGFSRVMSGCHSVSELPGRTIYIFDESDLCYSYICDKMIEESKEKSAYNLCSLCFTILTICNENYFKIHKEFPLREELSAAHAKIKKILEKEFQELKIAQFFPKVVFNEDKNKRQLRKVALFRPSGMNFFNIGEPKTRVEVYSDMAENAIYFNELAIEDKEKNEDEKEDTLEKNVNLSRFAYRMTSTLQKAISILSEISNQLLRKRQENLKEIQSGGEGSKNRYVNKEDTIESCINAVIHLYNSQAEVLFDRLWRMYNSNVSHLKITNSKLAENNVYNKGFQLISMTNPVISSNRDETQDDLSVCEMSITPEKFLLSLLGNKDTDSKDTNKIKNSIILLSATAENQCLRRNWSLPYIKRVIGNHLTYPSKDTYTRIKKSSEAMLSSNERPIECECMYDICNKKDLELVKDQLGRSCRKIIPIINEIFPAKYSQATKDTWWNKVLELCPNLEKNSDGSIPSLFAVNRFLKFVLVYNSFWNDQDLHTLFFFMNKNPDGKLVKLYRWTAALIEGSWEETAVGIEIPNVDGCCVLCSKDDKKIREAINNYVNTGKKRKFALVSAFGSVSTGVNYKFKIIGNECPNLGYIYPGQKEIYMDWSAVYVENPTNYVPCDPNEKGFNMDLLWLLARLLTEGRISRSNVRSILSNPGKQNQTVFLSRLMRNNMELACYKLAILEQAIGRITRTNHKGYKTKIYWDNKITDYGIEIWKYADRQKVYSREFEALLHSMEGCFVSEGADICDLMEEVKAEENNKNVVLSSQIDYRMEEGRQARHMTREELKGRKNPIIQEDISSWKLYLCKKPTPNHDNDLPFGIGDYLPELISSYRPSENHQPGYYFGDKFIDENYTRLPIFMKVPCIKEHFETNGFATHWEEGDYIMQYAAVQQGYMGEIGEQAFKAMMRHYVGVEMVSLPYQLWERADFLYKNLAFDVKNYNYLYDPFDGNPHTGEKYADKIKDLRRDLFIVQMVSYPNLPLFVDTPDFDGEGHHLFEVNGILDSNGNIIHHNIDKLSGFIKGAK